MDDQEKHNYNHQQQLQEKMAQLAAIVESTDDSIISKSLDSTIQSWNRGSEKMFGYTAAEAIGKNITMITPRAFLQQENENIQKVLNNEIIHFDTVRIKKNGEQFNVSITISPMLDQTGKVIGMSVIARDISEQKKLERDLKSKTMQLEQKNNELLRINKELAFQINAKEIAENELSITTTDVKDLEELVSHKESILAVLSHDLRSPLNGIIGMTDYLKMEFEAMERNEIQHVLTLLDESAKKELTLLDNLVEWARVKYASEAFNPQKLPLYAYVQEVIHILDETAALHHITLLNEIEEYSTVYADPNMLLSILQNIIGNALRYSKDGGKITIRCTPEANKNVIEVKGKEMLLSNTILENLFSTEMDSLTKAKKGNSGAGIGLLLARGFLHKNNGEIWVESLGERGSVFYFSLPVDKN